MADVRNYQGYSPKLGERVFVDRTAVVIGDVELGDDCSVWPLAVIRGDMHHIRIGAPLRRGRCLQDDRDARDTGDRDARER